MNKLLAALLLSLACAGANAASPQQDSALGESWDFCMGLVVGGLASNKVGGMSRSALWQAWSYLIRSGALDQISPTADYKAGLSRFQSAADTTAAEAVLQDATGECGIGRSGHQITGW
jgi:hypothetical protein